jgi:hypothetical protein
MQSSCINDEKLFFTCTNRAIDLTCMEVSYLAEWAERTYKLCTHCSGSESSGAGMPVTCHISEISIK